MKQLVTGHYDQLVTDSLTNLLQSLPANLAAKIDNLSAEDAIDYLAKEVAKHLRTALTDHIEAEKEQSDPTALTNVVLDCIGSADLVRQQVLSGIHERLTGNPVGPVIPLSQSALITNDQGLNYHAVIRSELLSSDRVDLICPFIGNQGLNLIFDVLARFGSKLRVITTTYLGGTNQRAIERLVDTGAQVKIVYERSDQKTGLHAKAWIFHRNSGFSTATIGSSNLSPRALVDGLEWNVRLGSSDSNQMMEELQVTFERLWLNPLFEDFVLARDSERLSRELRMQREQRQEPVFFADLFPLPHQEEALGELDYARLEGKSQNLVVAATGTGKTLLAAFDYERIAKKVGGRPSLLFIAHREDILKQSVGAFRAVMRDSDFGELHVGSNRAEEWKHVFASVQSLASKKLGEISPERFDVVVMDEFHHAEAPTYIRLLDHFKPKQLLGLTATPERSDGRNVIDRFGAPTYELRLWHALERNLLCPFHYFGVDDGTDLRGLSWSGRYEDSELNQQFVTQGEGRASLIVRELRDKVGDISEMRAVAFCATKTHANYMQDFFNQAGINSLALHSDLSREERDSRMKAFRRGEISLLCTVDLFNEGIDIPEINTVLFLRPTESATVFIQQLGRGLRNHRDKGALTVLDFVGLQNQKFRMDLRFRAMTGLSRTDLERSVKEGFPTLPPGCHIRLDRTTQDRVLKNLRDAIPSDTRSLIQELRRMNANDTPITVGSFLEETGITPTELYRGADRSLAALKKAAGLSNDDPGSARKILSVTHVDDLERIRAYSRVVREPNQESATYERMLSFPFTGKVQIGGLDLVSRNELGELLDYLQATGKQKVSVASDLPFALHAHYSRDEIVAPFRDNPASMRQGTFYVAEQELDVHLFTLRKSDRDFSPTTRYQDYFLSESTIHWESQSVTTLMSATGQRLVTSQGRHLLFAREGRSADGKTSPFVCLGFARAISHEGERPIKIVWELEHRVPDHLYIRLKQAAG